MRLETLQKHFWELMIAPEGAGKALAKAKEKNSNAAALNDWIGGETEADAIEKLDIYANMYFFRLLGVLQGDYPKLVSCIGDKRFHNLTTDYLLAHPPTTASIRHAGSKLPEFLRSHPLSRDFPFLADLAHFEWQQSAVFDAPDQAFLTASSLQELPAESWAVLELRRIEASRLVHSEYDLQHILEAIETGAKPAREKTRSYVLVWRRGFTTRHRFIDEEEFRLLSDLEHGCAFASICESIIQDEIEVQEAALRATQYLRNWIDQELLAGTPGRNSR